MKIVRIVWVSIAAICLANLSVPGGSAQHPPSHESAKASQACCAKSTSQITAKKETAKFASREETLLGLGAAAKGVWGILITDAESGEILFSQNADRFFVPASNMKLFTTALALEKLGPEFRFRTTVETTGSISPDGTLAADLLLVGRGDPNLSNRKFPYELKEEFDGPPEKILAGFADAIAAKGVKRIFGSVLGDDSYFPRERYPNGWEVDDMVWEYGAAISSIVVEDNTVTLTLLSGERTGDPVQAVLVPATPDFTVINKTSTSAAEVKSDLTLTREPGANLVTVSGTMPAKSAPRKLILAIQEPALHAAALLKKLLEERGIQIDGPAKAIHEPAEQNGVRTVLAEHNSIPLSDAVKLINKISQNLHTEMLLRTVARQKGPWVTPEELVKAPEEFYAAAGIAEGDVVQTDASGLSRHDLVTPRAIVSLLAYAQKRPWFGPYYASLPVAGVDGTLEDRMKNTVASGRIHAKTGSVEHVRTLSGFADTPSGRRLIFSFMSNNLAGKNHEATDALSGLCAAMLEEFNVTPKKRGLEHKQPH
jgi:D-alanyl-D-alanine carboxypeptidase/D-alanyl-D-alanine-endopeptidase (penicillin-binding protein 4)